MTPRLCEMKGSSSSTRLRGDQAPKASGPRSCVRTPHFELISANVRVAQGWKTGFKAIRTEFLFKRGWPRIEESLILLYPQRPKDQICPTGEPNSGRP